MTFSLFDCSLYAYAVFACICRNMPLPCNKILEVPPDNHFEIPFAFCSVASRQLWVVTFDIFIWFLVFHCFLFSDFFQIHVQILQFEFPSLVVLISIIKTVVFQQGPDILVCDEAHMIKNAKADITQALKQVRTQRRIALTGSPLQNNLMEYYCVRISSCISSSLKALSSHKSDLLPCCLLWDTDGWLCKGRVPREQSGISKPVCFHIFLL